MSNKKLFRYCKNVVLSALYFLGLDYCNNNETIDIRLRLLLIVGVSIVFYILIKEMKKFAEEE